MEKSKEKEPADSRSALGPAIGIGLVALAAAAAGTYFLSGKKGEKVRKNIKGWMIKMRGEIVEKMETIKELNEEAYNSIIDKVSEKYRKAKHIDVAQLEAEIRNLKNHWKSIYSVVGGGRKSGTGAKWPVRNRSKPR